MIPILQNKTTKSVLWSAAERFSVQAVQFLLNILLARLILPEEFGLVAMINVFMLIAQSFVDSGFSNALIQKKDRTEVDFCTVFFFNFFISVLIYALFYACAPLIARFYNEPRLIDLCRVLGLSLIIQGLSVVPIAKLTSQLDFKTQAKSSVTSIFISGAISLFFAYRGYGAWALVIQFVANCSLNTTLLYFFSKWKPRLIFSSQSLSGLFSFGSKLLIAGLLQTIYMNLYSLVIAKKYSALNIGFYNQSNLMARFPSVSLMAIITRALYPIQCSIQDKDDELLSSFYKYVGMSCFIVFPIMFSLTVLSKPIIMVVLTEKWADMSIIFSIICFANMWNAPIAQNNQILNVRGRSDLFLQAEVIKKIVGILVLVATLPFGMIIVCVGIVIYNVFDMTLMTFYAHKVLPFSYKKYLAIVIRYALLSIVAGIIAYLIILFFNSFLVKLLVGLITYCTLYFLLCTILKMSEVEYTRTLVKSIIKHG